MTKRLPRFDSHVQAFRDLEAMQAAQEAAAQERAANLPFCFDLKPSDFYATIFDSAHDAARPVGTITRPRMFGDSAAKLWTVSATDGVNVYQSALRPSAMQATRALIRHAAKLEAERAADLARRAADLEDKAAALQSSGPAFYREAAATFEEAARAYALADMPKGQARCALIAENLAYSFPALEEAPAIESGPVGPDWQGNGPAESFYAQAPALPNGKPGPFAFGPSEEAAREALARVMAPAPEEAPRPLAELLAEEAGAKAATRICRASLAELLDGPRPLSPADQSRLAALEEAAEKAEGDSDFRAAALAWAEGAKLCRVAGQMDSAAQWEGHCRKAAGAAFKAQGKAARKAAFALAPIAPRHDVPLCPSRPALARLAAIHAGAF